MNIFSRFTALTAAFSWMAYFGALFQLRSLEIHLADQCNALPMLADQQTIADVELSIQRLSLAVVEARNRVATLRPVPARKRSWRHA